jgi:hypothetical protein
MTDSERPAPLASRLFSRSRAERPVCAQPPDPAVVRALMPVTERFDEIPFDLETGL